MTSSLRSRKPKTYDGRTWSLTPEEFAWAIEGTDAARFIDTHGSSEE